MANPSRKRGWFPAGPYRFPEGHESLVTKLDNNLPQRYLSNFLYTIILTEHFT
jgi:hypothetical protein